MEINKDFGTSMHKMETCLMRMDLLDQFKKIACIGLNYGKQIEKNEIGEVRGMCMAIKGSKYFAWL